MNCSSPGEGHCPLYTQKTGIKVYICGNRHFLFFFMYNKTHLSENANI